METVIVLAVMISILSFGSILDINNLKNDTFANEEIKIISILAKARSRAITNYYNSDHGVCYVYPNYIIFRNRTTCTPTSDTDETIPTNINILSQPDTIFPTFIFARLSGKTTGATIHISDSVKKADIIINHEGAINW